MMKATHRYYGHGINDTVNVLFFEDGTEVYFAEDNNAMVVDPLVSKEGGRQPREYVEGENPDIDRYIGSNSNPILIYVVEHTEMEEEMETNARITLGL